MDCFGYKRSREGVILQDIAEWIKSNPDTAFPSTESEMIEMANAQKRSSCAVTDYGKSPFVCLEETLGYPNTNKKTYWETTTVQENKKMEDGTIKKVDRDIYYGFSIGDVRDCILHNRDHINHQESYVSDLHRQFAELKRVVHDLNTGSGSVGTTTEVASQIDHLHRSFAQLQEAEKARLAKDGMTQHQMDTVLGRLVALERQLVEKGEDAPPSSSTTTTVDSAEITAKMTEMVDSKIADIAASTTRLQEQMILQAKNTLNEEAVTKISEEASRDQLFLLTTKMQELTKRQTELEEALETAQLASSQKQKSAAPTGLPPKPHKGDVMEVFQEGQLVLKLTYTSPEKSSVNESVDDLGMVREEVGTETETATATTSGDEESETLTVLERLRVDFGEVPIWDAEEEDIQHLYACRYIQQHAERLTTFWRENEIDPVELTQENLFEKLTQTGHQITLQRLDKKSMSIIIAEA